MAVRWSIKDEKYFRISIRKLLKGNRRERKKIYNFQMNVNWTNRQRSYCSAVAFPSLHVISCHLFPPALNIQLWNDFSFTQLLRLVDIPVQFLFLPWCGCWMVPSKWALLDMKQLSKKTHRKHREEEKNNLIGNEFH